MYRCQGTLLAFRCGCTPGMFTFQKPLLAFRNQTLPSSCRNDHPPTHTHTHCSPLGEGIVAGKPFAAHHVVMETARTRTLVQESFCLSCLKSGINNIRISCYSLVLLITMQHWFIYTSNTSVLCKAHLQMFFITLHLTSSNTYKGHIYKSAQATWLFFMWLHLVS